MDRQRYIAEVFYIIFVKLLIEEESMNRIDVGKKLKRQRLYICVIKGIRLLNVIFAVLLGKWI